MRRRRDGTDRWEEIGWDEALDLAAGRLAEIQQRHGRDAVALYRGNPTSHSYSAVLFISLLKDQLGTRNVYSASPVDTLPRTLMAATLYGNQAVLPIPDLDRTDFLLALGANPAVSNGSVMTAPDVVARLRAIRERGGRIVVVDPRRTETAELADTHLFIRPGTDALLVAALLNVVFARGPRQARPARSTWSTGWTRSRRWSRPTRRSVWRRRSGSRPRRSRGWRAISPRRPRRSATGAWAPACRSSARPPPGWWTCSTSRPATSTAPGGAMFTTPAADLPRVAAMLGQAGHFDRWRSRVSNLPEFNGELPVACFAEEIETPGDGQVRALLTHAGNPVLSLPNGARLDRAFAKLEFMVAIDVYLNETTRHADLILPPTFGLEHEHYPVIFHGVAIRNTAHFSPAVLEKPRGQPARLGDPGGADRAARARARRALRAWRRGPRRGSRAGSVRPACSR